MRTTWTRLALVAVGLWGCGGTGDAPQSDAGTDSAVPTWELQASGLDVGGHLVVLHWSEAGGSVGESVVIGTWPQGAETFPLSLDGVSSPPAQRLDLSFAGEGTLSLAWLVVIEEAGLADLDPQAIIASSPSAMLVELSNDASAGSWAGRILNGAVPAGVHVVDIREYTQDELDVLTACMDNATGDPDLECPAFNEHVSLANPENGHVIQLAAGDMLPDLS